MDKGENVMKWKMFLLICIMAVVVFGVFAAIFCIRTWQTPTEIQIVAAEWSEHCSYKSSKKHLKMLPMSGPLVISEKGYDSGVLDVGDGYVPFYLWELNLTVKQDWFIGVKGKVGG